MLTGREVSVMTLVKWNPRTRELSRMHETIDDVIRDFFSEPWQAAAAPAADWMPRTDVVEEAGQYLVMLDLPGMKQEDIRISLDNGSLSIQGERKSEHESTARGYARFERASGSFTRTFSVPTTIDGKRIEAVYKDGVLTVVLPKSEEAHPKLIEVKVN
jgi:HSP20 family protein